MIRLPLESDEILSGASPFSFECGRCSRCCRGKRIRLLPYDILRLAEALGIDTGEMIRSYTEDGLLLKWASNSDACIFLGEEGCTVHSGRPAACRAYPLGHCSFADGTHGYVRLLPHAKSEGSYGEDGTIDEYVAKQGLVPYIEMAQVYNEILDDLGVILNTIDDETPLHDEPESHHVFDVDAELALHGEYSDLSAEDKALLFAKIMREKIRLMARSSTTL